MPIAFDAFWSSYATTWTTHTYSHTCTWSNRILFVSLLVQNPADIVTSVTYGGVSMTRIAANAFTGTEYNYLYYLIWPNSWANNVVISTSSSTTIYANSVSYTWAKQSWQPDAYNSQTTNPFQVSVSTSVTTVSDYCWLVWYLRSTASQTAQSWTHFRWWVNATEQIADSNWVKTPAWTYSLWTTFATAAASQIVAAFSPYTDPSIWTVKALVVAWWGGWWAWRWGGGGWGWVLYNPTFSISAGANAITVWNWWTWGTDYQNPNATAWWNSEFSFLLAYWWWYWASEWTVQQVWGNWWSGWGGTAVSASWWTGISWQWYAWWVWGTTTNYLAWWGWWWGSVWANASSTNWWNGWTWYTSSISGSSVNYAWGGGWWWNGWTPWSGTDGWGNWQITWWVAWGAWTDWLWSWWGGWAWTASRWNGWNGGSGVVIISYATDGSDWISASSTGGTITTSWGQTIHTFTTSWTFTAVASETNDGRWMLAFF